MGRTQRYRSFETNGKMKYSLDTRLQCYIALNTQMAGMHITATCIQICELKRISLLGVLYLNTYCHESMQIQGCFLFELSRSKCSWELQMQSLYDKMNVVRHASFIEVLKGYRMGKERRNKHSYMTDCFSISNLYWCCFATQIHCLFFALILPQP